MEKHHHTEQGNQPPPTGSVVGEAPIQEPETLLPNPHGRAMWEMLSKSVLGKSLSCQSSQSFLFGIVLWGEGLCWVFSSLTSG